MGKGKSAFVFGNDKAGTGLPLCLMAGGMLVRRQGRDGLATVAAAGEGRLWH